MRNTAVKLAVATAAIGMATAAGQGETVYAEEVSVEEQDIQNPITKEEAQTQVEEAQKAESEAGQKAEEAKKEYESAKKEESQKQEAADQAKKEAEQAQKDAENAFEQVQKEAQDAVDRSKNDYDQAVSDKVNADQAVANAEKDLVEKEKAEETAQDAADHTTTTETEESVADKKEAADQAEAEKNTAESADQAAEEAVNNAQETVDAAESEKENADKAVEDAQEEVKDAKDEADITKADADIAKKEYEDAVSEQDSAYIQAKTEADEAQEEVEEQKVSVEVAQADVDRAKDKLDAAEEALLQAKADKAQADVDAQQKVVDAAKKAYDTANNALKEAQAQLDEKKEDLKAAEKKADDALAAKEAAQEVLNKAKNDITEHKNALKEAQDQAPSLNSQLMEAENDVMSAESDIMNKQLNLEGRKEIEKLAKRDMEQAKADLDNFNKAAIDASGSKGFFDSINFNSSSVFNEGTYARYTYMGAGKDATSLDNMIFALDFIDKCNELRKANGLNELLISAELMACAQYDANASAYTMNHLMYFPYGENLAWGYSTPEGAFRGWYDEELEAKNRGEDISQYGHYLNIVNPDYKVTGFACNQYGNYRTCQSQMFGYNMVEGVTYYTTAQLRILINNYRNGGSLQSIYDTALTEYNKAKQNTAEAQAAYDAALAAKNSADRRLNDIRSAITANDQKIDDETNAIAQAQTDKRNAETSLITKEQEYTQAVAECNAIQNEVTVAETNAVQEKTNTEGKASELTVQKVTLDTLKDILKTAADKLSGGKTPNSIPLSQAELKLAGAENVYQEAREGYEEVSGFLKDEKEILKELIEVAEEKQAVVDRMNVEIARLRRIMEEKQLLSDQKEAALAEKQAALSNAQAVAAEKNRKLAALRTALQRAKEDKVSTASVLTAKAEEAERLKNLYGAAKASLDAYQNAQLNLTNAQADTSLARVALNVARNLQREKEQAVKDTKLDYESALAKLERVSGITLESAMETSITDEDYTYLNEYVSNISKKSAAFRKAKNELEQAKAITVSAKTVYDESSAKHIETIADLMMAKENYQRFVDEEKTAEEVKKTEEHKKVEEQEVVKQQISEQSSTPVAVAFGVTGAVKTGDPSQVGIMMSLFAGSAGVLGALCRKRKNKKC